MCVLLIYIGVLLIKVRFQRWNTGVSQKAVLIRCLQAPYKRKMDDRMQLVVQAGCVLMFLAGHVLRSQNTIELTAFEDLLLSIILIAVSPAGCGWRLSVCVANRPGCLILVYRV